MPRRIDLPSVEDVAQNLREVRGSATADQVNEGRGWYPAMNALILNIRDEAGHLTGCYCVTDMQAVGFFGSFSQNSTWKANVTMATNYLQGNGVGMRRVLAECEAIEDGADPTEYTVMGLKRADFCANLLGDYTRVTCDRWHLRAAFATDKPPTLSAGIHALVTEATRRVAAEFGESPASCQAVVWCAIRGDGK